MRLGELVDNGKVKRGLRVQVRVPGKLQEKLGPKASGTVEGLVQKTPGFRVQMVTVKIDGRRYTLRPQDLTEA